MTKKEAIAVLQEFSVELDQRWHASRSEGHDGHYRDLLDECMVVIDEVSFKLGRKWYHKLR
jgi:hypothetical protein